MAEETMASQAEQHSLINTNFPVLLPDMPELRLTQEDFNAHIRSLLPATAKSLPIRENKDSAVDTDFPAKEADKVTSMDSKPATTFESSGKKDDTAPFMTGLLSDKANLPSFDSRDGKMLTENADVAFRTSGEALMDLFYELEDVIGADRLKTVLDAAWADHADATLKIIWNSRSIHLGKGSRRTFYRAVGWLAQEHPLTLMENLHCLVRPLIQKKVPKKEDDKAAGAVEAKKDGEIEFVDAKEADSDFEMVEDEEETDKKEESEGQPEVKKMKFDEDGKMAKFDIKYGVSHGYWKDLLNILALAANGELKVDGDVRSILNAGKPAIKPRKRDWTQGRKEAITTERHERVVAKLKSDKFYQALHLTVARLFAQQLGTDTDRLKSGRKADIKIITLAAKWAPTHKGMHDQHTCIVSTIAELLHPFDNVCPETVDAGDRELYLKYARIAYQSQTISPLRKHLQVVERDITAETFEKIKYERVPSLAMKQYTPLFAKKDYEHFDQYIDKVASGKKTISGATLLPSTLVQAVKPNFGYSYGRTLPSAHGASAMVEQKLRDLQARTIDAQWNTLVQRIKDSGTLESSIAVCDVSGSMSSPTFADGTCPMHSSIGLSLLLADVTKPPFGGAMITFSEEPQVLRVGGADDKRSFQEKIDYIARSNWGGSTDFVAVFEKLILPMAVKNKLSQEDMVKQVFVFSDMQFNTASHGSERWTTSYERIQKNFKKAGYEMPQLVFWNLAGGRAGHEQTTLSQLHARQGDDTAPKPVHAAEEGTVLVSGYSQAMLKVFLDNGSFDDPEDDDKEVEYKEGEDGEVVLGKKAKDKKKQDPLSVMRKAIGHEAYRMLKVVD